jgi:hypothetical protein
LKESVIFAGKSGVMAKIIPIRMKKPPAAIAVIKLSLIQPECTGAL